jgi:histidyl-tRNA synthetase
LLHENDLPLTELLALKSALVAEGSRVRLVSKPKNIKPTLEALAIEGFTRFAFVEAGTTLASISLRPLTETPQA